MLLQRSVCRCLWFKSCLKSVSEVHSTGRVIISLLLSSRFPLNYNYRKYNNMSCLYINLPNFPLQHVEFILQDPVNTFSMWMSCSLEKTHCWEQSVFNLHVNITEYTVYISTSPTCQENRVFCVLCHHWAQLKFIQHTQQWKINRTKRPDLWITEEQRLQAEGWTGVCPYTTM